MAFKIKFFYLLYGEMGLLILKYLIKEGLVPDLVISHKSYNIEGNKEFYSGLTKLYEKDNLNIVYTDNIFDYKKEMKSKICPTAQPTSFAQTAALSTT